MSGFLILKWIHVVLAIIAVGANITYGVWLSRGAREPQHLGFVLRGIRILDNRIANPAYGLLLLTGFALAGMGRIPVSTPWVLTGIVLWIILVIIAAAGYTPGLRRQIQALDAGGPTSPEYRRLEATNMRLGILLLVIAVAIVFDMVIKPALWAK
jgi:uncharacterized membrane protein